jgi:hypothetical protein
VRQFAFDQGFIASANRSLTDASTEKVVAMLAGACITRIASMPKRLPMLMHAVIVNGTRQLLTVRFRDLIDLRLRQWCSTAVLLCCLCVLLVRAQIREEEVEHAVRNGHNDFRNAAREQQKQNKGQSASGGEAGPGSYADAPSAGAAARSFTYDALRLELQQLKPTDPLPGSLGRLLEQKVKEFVAMYGIASNGHAAGVVSTARPSIQQQQEQHQHDQGHGRLLQAAGAALHQALLQPVLMELEIQAPDGRTMPLRVRE